MEHLAFPLQLFLYAVILLIISYDVFSTYLPYN